MAAFLPAAAIGLSMVSSYLNIKGQADDIKNLNEAKLQQFEANKAIVAEMLGTLDSRTSRAETEATRKSVRNKLNIRKAQMQAEGDATVRAAQMGGGAGVRASLATFRPSERIAGDMITDVNVNLQTELTNITEHFNDTAAKAIANLNNNAPILGTPPGTGEMIMNSAAAGLNAYNSMSPISQAELKGLFKFDSEPDSAALI